MRISIIVVALMMSVAMAPGPKAFGQSYAIAPDKIDAIFKDFGPTTPGCALGIYSAGKVLYAKGYGMADLDLDVPITPQTVFDIGSTSKQFTAAATVLLANEGKLSLTDDIRKFLPELPNYGHIITIDHLLHHTSGLRDYDGLLYLAGHYYEDFTDDQDALTVTVAQRALNFTPGSQWSYSNTGYFLLALIVQRASGTGLADYAKTHFFVPLGMTATHFRTDHTAILKERAVAYDPLPGGGFKIDMSNWDQIGDGGINTNVLELARWDANFYDAKIGGKAFIDKMVEPALLDDGKETNYARGLFRDSYRGLRRIQHGGAWAGYRAMLMRFPEQRLSVGMTCNISNANTTRRAEDVADVMLAETFKEPRAMEGKASSYSGPVPDLQSLAGSFVSEGAQNAVLISIDKDILVANTYGQKLRMEQTGPRRFSARNLPLAIEFDAGGRTLTLELNGEKDPPYLRTQPYHPLPRDLEALAGRYHSAELGTDWSVRIDKAVAHVSGRAVGDSTIQPVSKDIWVSENGRSFFVFKRRNDGRVSGFDFSTSRILRIGFER